MRMKTLALAVCALMVAATSFAWPRLGQHTQPTMLDTGNTASYLAVAVNDTTPVLIYSGTDDDREVTIQNPSATYDMYVGSSTAVRAVAGARLKIPKGNGTYTTHNTANIYAIMESGGSGTALGSVEHASQD